MKPTLREIPAFSPGKPESTAAAEWLGTLLICSGVASGAPPSVSPASSGEPGKPQGNLEPIVVTADKNKSQAYKPDKVSSPKYPAPLRDTPKTITVIPEQVIQEQGARTLTEVLRNVPGISIQAGEGGGASNTAGDAFSMWGFDASQSVFRDGARDMGLISRDTFNMESVEAFPGPGGSDVGRGSAAGYVNTVSKTPRLEDLFAGSATFGSAQRLRGTLDLNQRIEHPNLPGWLRHSAYRLNVMGETGDVPNRDRVERNGWGVAPAVAVGLGTPSRFTLFSQHVRQDNIPDYGLPMAAGRPVPGVHDDWFYGSTQSTYEDIEQDLVTGVYEHDVNDRLTLRNLSRFGKAYRDAVVLSPGYSAAGLVTRSLQANERTNEIFLNQTTLTYQLEQGAIKQTITAALEYSEEEQTAHTGSRTLTPMSPATEPTDFAESRPAATTHSQGESDTFSVSLFDQVEFGSRWILTGGLRLDHYDTAYQARSPVSATNPDGWVDQETADTVYSGRIGLTFKPVEEGSIYLAFANTVTPPGTANFTLSEAGTSQDNPELDPQESRSIALGAKWDLLDGSLGLSAAVFHTQNTNVLYNDDTTGTYYTNGGQDVNGFTLGANGKLTDAWQVFANATWLDATVDQPGDISDGMRVIRTPQFSASLWTTYALPWNLTIGAGLRYQGESEANAANTVQLPAYAVMDLMLQYDLNDHVNFRLNVTNLLNRDYISSINNNTQRYANGEPLGAMFSTNFTF